MMMNEVEMNDTLKSLTQDGDVIKCGEKLIFNPFNPENKEITLNEVQSILNKHGITAKVHNLELYKRAFVHSSYVKRPELDNMSSNIVISAKPLY
jgi:dsRNA-specific ribonuclease